MDILHTFRVQHLDALRGFDACFFCLGASSIGMSAEDYRRLTYDLTLAVAWQLLPGNPRMYLSIFPARERMRIRGKAGARESRNGSGAVQNGIRDSYGLRPGFIQPMRGATSRMCWMHWLYAATAPMYPFLQKRLGRFVTSTDLLAAAMLQLATTGSPNKTLNTGELSALATQEIAV